MRGCRDNSVILRTLCDRMLELDKSVITTFIDYSAVFDSMSHRFIDVTLKEAGVPTKLRAMYRAVWAAALVYTSVPSADGKQVNSDTFAINRGVVQGNFTSPLYFILTLELILRRHDQFPDKGVPFSDVLLHT